MLTVDAGELTGFANAMKAAPGMLQSGLRAATQGLVATGVAMAQDNAPRMDGVLANSIQPISSGMDGLSGEFGTSLVYAWQREMGGTIYPKKGKYLVFTGRDGQLVFARSVTQSGSFYMQRTANQLRPLVFITYAQAVDRVLAAIAFGQAMASLEQSYQDALSRIGGR